MVWITFCQKVFYFSGSVFCRALFPYAGITPSRQWFHENEDTAGSFSDIFGIRLLYVARAHRQRLQMVIQHLVWLFVHADHRHFRIIWLFIYIEDIFHARYKIRIFLWRDTPVVIHVGTEFVFLNTADCLTTNRFLKFQAYLFFQKAQCPPASAFRCRSAGNPDNLCLGPAIRFPTGI